MQDIYADTEARTREIQAISTGDPFDEFYRQYKDIKEHHRQYPNEPVENLERAYKRRVPAEGESAAPEVDSMFTGQEAWGSFMDLTTIHEDYLNLPHVKRLNYVQYLDNFDRFTPPQCTLKLSDKRTDQYFRYVGRLSGYLEDYMRRTRPLEDLDKLFAGIEADFAKEWSDDAVPGWSGKATAKGASVADSAGPATQGGGEGIWCPTCAKEFKNDNVYKAHLTGKKHVKAAAAARPAGDGSNGTAAPPQDSSLRRLKDRAIAEREYRASRLAAALSTARADTRANVERKQGMTERERQQDLEAMYAAMADPSGLDGGAGAGDQSEEEGDYDDKLDNPLKLPLAWDGKPIPYWLYKLHGLGVEFPCEVCGNYVYMGRRAFDKHFSEARHIYGLKCLGITNTGGLFREITKINEAVALWQKLQENKSSEESKGKDIVQMEDPEGNVMPEKVYFDLVKQGLI